MYRPKELKYSHKIHVISYTGDANTANTHCTEK